MSGFLAGAGVLLASAASAAAILLPPGRRRSAAMLVALALFPVLILGDQWHSHRIVELRDHLARSGALVLVGAAAVGALAYVFRRWSLLLPLAIVFALPFRIPLESGGETANLLVPLYVVIAAGVVTAAVRDWASPPPPGRTTVWLPRILAVVVVLYAVQTWYSADFSKGLQNVCFFLVPFTVAYALLQDVRWDRRLLTWVLVLVGAEAAVFVLIGTVEYVTESLFWNPQVIRSNEFHTYFRVNSMFWDPNIYGRYLALVIVVATAALLWVRERRSFAALTVLVGFLWLGLAQTFSQSSYVALLSGLAVLAAIRWSWRWTLAAAVVGIVGAALVVTLVGGKSVSSIPGRINLDTSGRANLVKGGAELFGERPLWGYGSGSFQEAYRAHREAAKKNVPVSVSHTEPITVAAEQGVIGLAAYGALVIVALWTMSSGLWSAAARSTFVARAAVLAAFVALLVHTMAYAGFFEDPITWVLLAAGASLAAAPAVAARSEPAPVAVRDAA